jgi:hypothetical protein
MSPDEGKEGLMSRLAASLVALGLLTVLGGSARAQAVVPGGWAPTFGYQSFGMGFGPGAGNFGFGGGFSPYGFSGNGFGYGGYPVAGGFPYAGPNVLSVPVAPPMTVTTMDPLIQAIQQAPRAPGRRRFRR